MLCHCHLSVDRMISVQYLWQILLSFEHSDPWPWIALGIATLPVFKQEALRCKNKCFCYLYMNSLFFIWFWWGLFCNQFLKKMHFRKVHSIVMLLLPFQHKNSSNVEFKNLNFFSLYFILKKDLKGAQILKFYIFGRQMSKIQWVQRIIVSSNNLPWQTKCSVHTCF